MDDLYFIAPNVWVRKLQLPGFDVCNVLIRGADHSVVWDTLSQPKDLKPFLTKIGDSKLTIVYSHADWDHIWGTGGLPFQGANIIGHEFCLDRFSHDVPKTLQQKRSEDRAAFQTVELIAPTQTFTHTHLIDLQGINLELHHLPGHTQDSIVGFLPEQGILLMGDTVETPLPCVPENPDLSRWISGLKQWKENPRVNTVIPSHGPIGGREIISHNIDYLQKLQDGEKIEITEKLNDFYRTTHENNLDNV